MSSEQFGTGPEVETGHSLAGSVGDPTSADAEAEASDDAADRLADDVDDAVYYEEQVEPEYGILGFTLRELIVIGAWAVLFAVSFFAVFPGGASVWTLGIAWVLTIGLPTAAVFLIVLRRFSPEGIRRVGSLGIDQFASVAASVAAVAWGQLLWVQVASSLESRMLLVGWVPIVALVAVLVLVVATVAAPLIPRLRDDFEGRMETLAHRNANPVRPVITRPRPVAEAEPAAASVDLDAPAEPIVDTDLSIRVGDDLHRDDDRDDDDATRVIEVLPFDTAPTTAPVSAPAADVAPVAVTPAEPSTPAVPVPVEPAAVEPVEPVEPAPVEVPATETEAREDDTAYTDPIEALHEIFAAEATSTGEQAAEGPAAEVEPPLRRTRNEQARAVESEAQPFWILAQTERDVLDEHGHPLFRIGPEAWTLVIEDRGGAYVVRLEDGRIGYLHDLADITKG